MRQFYLAGNVEMIEGDVMLKGQGTDKQSLEPVMGTPGDEHGTMTFFNWLDAVIPSGKGIKIDIKSTDVVEIALQTLKGFKGRVSFNASLLSC